MTVIRDRWEREGVEVARYNKICVPQSITTHFDKIGKQLHVGALETRQIKVSRFQVLQFFPCLPGDSSSSTHSALSED